MHAFDPTTFAEPTPTWLAPSPGDKIVDLAFRPGTGPTPALPSSWGSIQRRYL